MCSIREVYDIFYFANDVCSLNPFFSMHENSSHLVMCLKVFFSDFLVKGFLEKLCFLLRMYSKVEQLPPGNYVRMYMFADNL